MNKYYGITNIKDYPLRKLADFLMYAYEKEIYERWLTIYPLMEAGLMNYVSFKEYKEKITQNMQVKKYNETLTDEEIIKQGMRIVEVYENRKKVGEKGGNI